MSSLKKALADLHQDDKGMETLQVVIIFGVAALVLALLYKAKDPIWNWVKDALSGLGISVS